MRQPYYEQGTPMEPYYSGRTFGAVGDDSVAASCWHAVSREPLTRPPISSVTARVTQLEDYE